MQRAGGRVPEATVSRPASTRPRKPSGGPTPAHASALCVSTARALTHPRSCMSTH